MLWIAVCDDEVMECAKTAGKIREIFAGMHMSCTIRQFYSGRELLQSSESFDIIFLDIIMGGMDGMRTAQFVREKAYDKLLIFISASRDYVFDAYDVEAFQYLVKPIEGKKLKMVLEKAVCKTKERSQAFLLVSRDRQQKKLFLDEIYYFEIQGRLIEVHGMNGIFSYYGQIGLLERELQGKGFFRCHKSYLVNLKYVDVYNRQETVLENGERIAIAKRRYDAFCGEILRYMRAINCSDMNVFCIINIQVPNIGLYKCYPLFRTYVCCGNQRTGMKGGGTMKGYAVESGYMGYVNGAYMLFASETDYADYMSE